MSNNPIINQIEKEDNKRYQKAFQDALKLRDSINKLNHQQREKLLREIVELEGATEFFNIAKSF